MGKTTRSDHYNERSADRREQIAEAKLQAATLVGMMHMAEPKWPKDAQGNAYETVYRVDGVITGTHERQIPNEVRSYMKENGGAIYAEGGIVTEAGKAKYPIGTGPAFAGAKPDAQKPN